MPLCQGPPARGSTIKGHRNSMMGSAGNRGRRTGRSQEESYQLLAHPEGSTLPFAMIIRLTPEILEELKHAEAEGVVPRMKFGDNVGSHVIEVGPETFQFSSAPELGNLCDIYIEQIEESGQHVLREAGSAQRKLLLQRILSDTEKGRLKQRTAEADSKQKLRKSILVDQNTQMSIPQAALTEADTKKSLPIMEKEPPLKKLMVTQSPMPSAKKQSNATGNYSLSSPASPLPELISTVVRETPGMPVVASPLTKSKPVNGGEAFVPTVNKATFSQKQRAPTTTTLSAGSKVHTTNIRNLLINLLQESSKGMTIKALEKAVTDGLSVNPERKLIEKIIKSIATYHAPGKYILNPGVEKGTFVEATAGSSGKALETSCVGAREEEPLPDSMVETICQKETNLEWPEVSYNRTHDSPAKHIFPQPVNSQLCTTNDFDERSPTHGEMDAKAAGSSGSDSSSTNESESESDTSGNRSATSASESSSGMESDVSSSSEASMDEDVDIMSDGEDEKRSDVRQQKSKAEDVTLPSTIPSTLIPYEPMGYALPHVPSMPTGSTKEVIMLQDDFKNLKGIESGSLDKHNPSPEIQQSFPGEARPTSEDMKVREQDCMDDIHKQDTLTIHTNTSKQERERHSHEIQEFGLDEDVNMHSNVLLGNDNQKNSLNFDNFCSTLNKEANIENSPLNQTTSNKDKEMLSETPNRNREQGRNGSQERRKRYGSDQSTSLSLVDVRAGKKAKQVDILVDKGTDEMSDSTWCVKAGAHQSMTDQSPPCKLFEMAENRDTDQHSQKGKARHPNKKAVLNGDNLSSKNISLSLEGSEQNFDDSSLNAKDRRQRVGRPSREANSVSQSQIKQHSRMKIDRMTTTNERKKHGKEADKHGAKSSECSSQIARTSSRPGKSSSLCKNVKGFLGTDDDSRSNEGIVESSMHRLTTSGETSARLGKSMKAQQCPRKFAGANNLEVAEKNSSVEEQAEKPSKDAGFSNQSGDYGRKDGLKEEELTARPSNNSISSKEGRKMETAHMDSGHSSRSGHAFSRGSFNESKRNASQDLELGEFREPPSENDPGELRRLTLRGEKECFEATSRETYNIKTFSPDSERLLPVSRSRPDVRRASPGPDSERLLPLSRSRPDVMKASPGQGENSSMQELHSKERMTQDAKRAEPYRTLKKNLGAGESTQKLGADRVRQLQHGRSVSVNKDLEGSARSGGSDLLSRKAGSKETSRKHANKLLGDSKASALSQQKRSSDRSFPDNEKLRQDHIAKDLRMSCRKQTPQSSEVQGGEFFALYEKEEPELRGTIYSLDQFRDYYKEYNEKYPIYAQLNASLENDKESFEIFRKNIEEAKRRGDMAKLASIHGRVKKEYFQCRKRSKRMRCAFKVLHKELQVIKQHCKDYAQKSRR
eukprot:c21937_g1_i1 orf=98-4279(-)